MNENEEDKTPATPTQTLKQTAAWEDDGGRPTNSDVEPHPIPEEPKAPAPSAIPPCPPKPEPCPPIPLPTSPDNE